MPTSPFRPIREPHLTGVVCRSCGEHLDVADALIERDGSPVGCYWCRPCAARFDARQGLDVHAGPVKKRSLAVAVESPVVKMGVPMRKTPGVGVVIQSTTVPMKKKLSGGQGERHMPQGDPGAVVGSIGGSRAQDKHRAPLAPAVPFKKRRPMA